jgi:site-specific DNA recombinase
MGCLSAIKKHGGGFGEHEPILERALFEAVQNKLAASATTRQLKIRGSPSILAGRIFDERGGRMTPTHTNKNGARYRYYISHGLLQKRNDKTTGLRRVSAHEIERAVTKALRDHIRDSGADERSGITDRELVEELVDRIIVTSQMIEIQLRQEEAGASKSAISAVLKVRWKGPEAPNAKGILHSPLAGPPMIAGNRDVLLTAIAKARAWIADLAEGRAASLAEIAKREGKVERHIRLLAPLAFVSPQFVSGIIDGHVPSVAVTALAKHVSWPWAQQRTDVSS